MTNHDQAADQPHPRAAHQGVARQGVRGAHAAGTDGLEPIDGGTELTLIHEQLADEETRESHEAGWNGLLDKLEVFVGDAS